jgi:signal transduction histidine kinase
MLDAEFRALLKSYSAAIGALSRLHEEKTDQHSLAGWALRTTSNGWAILQTDEIRLTNAAFDRIEHASSDPEGWREVVRTAESLLRRGAAHPSLRALALAESKHLDEGHESARTRRFSRGTVFVEMTVERTSSELGEMTTFAVVRDIAQFIEMEERRAALQREMIQKEGMRVIGELSFGVAHDLENLLGALGHRLAALEVDGGAGNGAFSSNVEAMHRILESGKALLGKLQATAHSKASVPTAVDLGGIVAAAIEVAQSGSEASPSKRSLVVRAALPSVPRIWGVPDDLRNVFVNLFLNAEDAMPNGGTVTVTAEALPDIVLVRVEDEGTGIRPADVERIFEPFFTTKQHKGVGIGLALARETMRQSGGDITARNLPAGGACFELWFRPATG